MDHAEYRRLLARPQLTPDVIDDFVTWFTEVQGIKTEAFRTAEMKYKRELFSKFWKGYPEEKKNYRMF